MVQQIRQSWPQVRIILRADSGFCREPFMSWCEANGVDYVFGFARNERLWRIIEPQMQQAAVLHRESGQAARVFTEFAYETNTSWGRPRRVVAKAEQIEGKENPRYVVTSLEAANWPAGKLYEQLYCARGDMENRIKEQYSLFAGRVSAATMRANQLRLYLSAAAYLLLSAFRRLALVGTGSMQDHPLTAASHRCPGTRDGSQGLDLDCEQLSALACLRSGPPAVALLKETGSTVL